MAAFRFTKTQLGYLKKNNFHLPSSKFLQDTCKCTGQCNGHVMCGVCQSWLLATDGPGHDRPAKYLEFKHRKTQKCLKQRKSRKLFEEMNKLVLQSRDTEEIQVFFFV